MSEDFWKAMNELGKELREHAEPGDPFHPDTPWSMEKNGDGWTGEVKGFCPTQGDGTVDGFPWYYRSRGGAFSFSVAAKADGDPVGVKFGDEPGWCVEGDAAEWEPVADAWTTVIRCIGDYRASKREDRG